MPVYLANHKYLVLLVCLLIGTALACNAPGNISETTATFTPPATFSATPDLAEPTIGAPETLPAIVASATLVSGTETQLPTFTPIQAPTLKATLTPSATPQPKPPTNVGGAATKTPSSTGTPSGSQGPLEFDYRIEWRFKDASAQEAVATVTISARGGGGGYIYFRDEIEVDGPVFEYQWRTCSGNPGSLRVTAADGQTKRINYFESPPCPTSTPLP